MSDAARTCAGCGVELPADAHFNRRFCSDACVGREHSSRSHQPVLRTRPRAITINLHRVGLRVLREEGARIPTPEHERPRTRGECRSMPRPCPFVSCRHHLYLEASERSIKVAFPDLEPDELVESCSLDVADRGEHTLEEVGELVNVTREHVRQICDQATPRLAIGLRRHG